MRRTPPPALEFVDVLRRLGPSWAAVLDAKLTEVIHTAVDSGASFEMSFCCVFDDSRSAPKYDQCGSELMP